jgi:arylsulfatase A-like enzyme
MNAMLFRLRLVLTTIGLTSGLAVQCVDLSAQQPPGRKPNVLLIMVDDLGWMDLHCQGNDRLETPALDRLAQQGVRFLNAYAAAPVCSPTRAALMTGKSPARLGITNHISGREFIPDGAEWLPTANVRFLDTAETTLAESLRDAGYRTAFFGKWHLAGVPGRQGLGDPRYYPEQHGFDVNFGGCAHGGPPTFFDPYGIHNLANREKGEYLPDRLVDEVIGYLGGSAGAQDGPDHRPFFVTLWNYTVHWPMEAPEQLVQKYQSRLGPGIKDARYAAMIEAMDRALGRLFRFLDQKKLSSNTLVIFTSDNGAYGGVADNRPLRAAKGYLYEGGIRVPLMIRWPQVTQPGQQLDSPVITMDLHATILDAVGLPPAEPTDGRSLRGLLRGKPFADRPLYFHYPNYAWHRDNRLGGAIRDGDYKLIEWFDDQSVELYNLRTDIGERRNLATANPQLARQLQAKLTLWRKNVGAIMPKHVE